MNIHQHLLIPQTFIAGWDNTSTRLYKGTKMLAENSSDAARFIRPINTNPMYHNRWYYIRAEARHATKDGKKGVMLRVSLDDVPLFEYFDAAPLPAFENGGRVAFWTVDSVTMIARAKIESENLLTRSVPAGLPDATTQPILASTREGDLAPRSEITDSNRASAVIARDENGSNDATWTVTNPASGGSFLVQLGDDKSRAVSPTSKLEFDAAIPSGVDVDAYARADGQLYEIDLGGKKYRDARVTSLGAATKKTTDSGWTHFSFPLGEALKKQGVAKIDALQLGALHGDEYRWAGFGGNLLGSSYKIRNVRLVN